MVLQNSGGERGGGGVTRCIMAHVKMVNSSILCMVNITNYNSRVMTCAQNINFFFFFFNQYP